MLRGAKNLMIAPYSRRILFRSTTATNGPVSNAYLAVLFGVRTNAQPYFARSMTTARYKRACLVNSDDIQRIYNLLPAYIRNPSLGHSINEVVIRVDWADYPWTWKTLSRDPCGPSPAAFIEDQNTIKDYIERLCLDPSTTRKMLEALDWWSKTWEAGQATVTSKEAPGEPQDPYAQPEAEDDPFFSRPRRVFGEMLKALFLSLCPNIETVRFGGTSLSDGRAGLLEDYLRASNYGLFPQPIFQNVRHVRYLRHPDDSFFEEIEYYPSFDLPGLMRFVHRLPKLTSVVVEGVCDYEQWNTDMVAPGTSNTLKQLQLTHVEVGSDQVASLIRIPTALEDLRVSFGGLLYRDCSSLCVSPTLLGKAIRQHKPTLQSLELDLGCGGVYVYDYDEPNEYDLDEEGNLEISVPSKCEKYHELDMANLKVPLLARDLAHDHKLNTVGSLKDFIKLTRLSISIEFLISGIVSGESLAETPECDLTDTLPPNLEYLCLYGYKKGFNKQLDRLIRDFMKDRATRLPTLREVVGVDQMEPGAYIARQRGRIPREHVWKAPDDEEKYHWIEADGVYIHGDE